MTKAEEVKRIRQRFKRPNLEKNGTPIGPYDILIAATALSKNATLVTHNIKEFNRVENLTVEDWY